MTNKFDLCIALVILFKRANDCGNQNAADTYSAALNEIIKRRGFTKVELCRVMKQANEQYQYTKPTVPYFHSGAIAKQ